MLPRAKDIESALWRTLRVADRLAAMEEDLEVPHENSASASAYRSAHDLTIALTLRRQEQWTWDFLDRLDRETVDVTSEAAQVMVQWMRSMLKAEAGQFEERCVENLRSAERSRRETEERIEVLAFPLSSDLSLEPTPGGN
jgi:hypothetical protein